jgi:subtilase family serine protease
MKIRSTLGAAIFAAALSTSFLAAPALAGPFEQGEDGTGVGISITPATQPLAFTAFLPLRNEAALDKLIAAQTTPGSPSFHKWLTPGQFNAAYGPTAAQLQAAVTGFQALGLTAAVSGPRQVHVSGTAAQVQTAFATQLRDVKGASGKTRVVAAGTLALSPALKAAGVMIPAFANKALLKSAGNVVATDVPDTRYGPASRYYFTDLKQAYDYPSHDAMRNGKRVDGTGASVAIVMEDEILDTDIVAYFGHEAWTANTTSPIPVVNHVAINGGGVYGGPGTFEASLDTQMVTGGAPGANTTLLSIPSLADANIADAYAYAVNSNLYDIVSSSFGGPESFYLAAFNGGTDYTYLLKVEDGLFKQGNAEGITFVASSGDEGALQNPGLAYLNNDPRVHPVFVPGVSTPASSPHVVAVGGGNLITSFIPGATTSTYVAENGLGDAEVPHDPYGFGHQVSGGYWGAGGGISQVFGKPSYQRWTPTGSVTKRTLPDVGMIVGGCPGGLAIQPCGTDGPRSYVITYVGGRRYGLIGTSVSAPEFAGALALYVGQNGRLGNANAYLYAAGQAQAAGGPAAFHTTHPSFDGYWRDGNQGGAYDYIFGNGSPDVRVLFGFTDLDPAGDPKTASNP